MIDKCPFFYLECLLIHTHTRKKTHTHTHTLTHTLTHTQERGVYPNAFSSSGHVCSDHDLGVQIVLHSIFPLRKFRV